MRKRFGLIYTGVGLLVALFGALQLVGKVRLVDVLLLFFGGFGAGVGLVKAIIEFRKMKQDNSSPS